MHGRVYIPYNYIPPMSDMRILLAALSVVGHRDLRCYQRYTISALTVQRDSTTVGGYLRLDHNLGLICIQFLLSMPNAEEREMLQQENETHGDLQYLPIPNSEQRCAEKIFYWLRLASHVHAADFIGVLDDDIFLHPTRLATDLRQFVGLSRAGGRILLGEPAFLRGWRALHHVSDMGHFVHLPVLVARHLSSNGSSIGAGASVSSTQYGPFPFVMGYLMILSPQLARDVGSSPAVAQLLCAPQGCTMHASNHGCLTYILHSLCCCAHIWRLTSPGARQMAKVGGAPG